MKFRGLAGVILLALAPLAHAYTFLVGYDEAPNVAAALERIKGQPDRHVLLYFGMSEFCPPCKEARAVLNSERVREKWRPNYVVVNIDLFAPTREEREVIDQVRVSWAPVLVFLNASGKRVAYARQLRGEQEALQLNEFVSQHQYALSTLGRFSGQDFDSGRMGRIAAEAGAVTGTQRIDDRPRLRDVTSQPHERLQGAELKKLLAGKRMRKENQDWFLTLEFRERNLLEAAGERKNGTGEMRGTGKWYVTRKGKLCLEFDMRGVDENWCRHVFRAGETYYLSKDLRPDRLVHRMVAAGG
ncbi:MAG TPA: thioredoxin family protein [Burkholderiales bacterium]|nr:thioredoxin family protein [Burkholderiales bacterium]